MPGRRKELFEPEAVAPFALSRSKLDLFIDCPRCFYADRKLGIARPSGPSFALNLAVDTLLKREFDGYRAKGKPHPFMVKQGLKAVPFSHEDLETWRSARKGVRHHHQASKLELYGALDDVWVKPDGGLLVVDYKTTSKADEVTLNTPYAAVYKRQLEVYQWLLRANGFDVDPTAYLVYTNAGKDRSSFDGRLEFSMTLLSHNGDDTWIPGTLKKVRACLMSADAPEASTECVYCAFVDAMGGLSRREGRTGRSAR